jgi:hypothetical protein
LDNLEELDSSIYYTETSFVNEIYAEIAVENNNQTRQLENFNKTSNNDVIAEVS